MNNKNICNCAECLELLKKENKASKSDLILLGFVILVVGLFAAFCNFR